MTEDFFYALIIGWLILLLFWIISLVFIYLRKPVNAKLSSKIIIYSSILFISLFVLIIFFSGRFVLK